MNMAKVRGSVHVGHKVTPYEGPPRRCQMQMKDLPWRASHLGNPILSWGRLECKPQPAQNKSPGPLREAAHVGRDGLQRGSFFGRNGGHQEGRAPKAMARLMQALHISQPSACLGVGVVRGGRLCRMTGHWHIMQMCTESNSIFLLGSSDVTFLSPRESGLRGKAGETPH